MKLLYTSQDRILLYLLKARLDENHIHTVFKNEQPPLAGEIPPIIAWPQLYLLNDGDLERATRCIQEEIAAHNTINPGWQCPKCKEKLEGQFDICWHCGSARE